MSQATAQGPLTVSSPLIAPVFAQEQHNTTIPLGTFEAELTFRGQTFRGTARAEVEFAPDPREIIVFPIPTDHPSLGFQMFAYSMAATTSKHGEPPGFQLTRLNSSDAIDVISIGAADDGKSLKFTPKARQFSPTGP